MSEFGPFVNIMALASALVAVFGTLAIQSVGPLERWINLVDDSPTFLVAAGPRLVAIGLIAATYLWAASVGSRALVVLALIASLVGYLSLRSFDRLRRSKVVRIPIVGSNGQQVRDGDGKLQFRNVIVGSEGELRDQAARDYYTAQQRRPGLSLSEFMSGYGSPPNNPESLWPKLVLVQVQMQITARLSQAVIAGAMTLFWAALAVDLAAS